MQLEIDRRQANALGVSFADIGTVLDVAVGSSYVNDFPTKAACSGWWYKPKATSAARLKTC